jgi:CubicO group peptidase (beta-lactamase class C family)
MDEYVASQVKARRFMGSVLVVRDGQTVLKKGYGMADLELDVPNRPETKFRLGSITKQFVAVGILQLEEKGKLSVKDPVCKYVEACPQAWKGITIHHLLSHTSGIPNFTSFPEYRETWSLPSRPDKTLLRFKDRPHDFKPGERWSYSNSGYILLGYLLEKISGEKYEDYMRKHVFDAAGMADSGHDTHEEILKNRASGYSRASDGKWVNSAYHDMSIPIGGGDLYSTVEDLYKWDQALVSGKVLKKQSLEKMFTPVMNNYGYGTAVDKQYGRLRYSHGGGINGFATFLARFPEQKTVVAVLGNMDFANSGEVASNLVRMLFGEKTVRPEDRKAISLGAALVDYVGRYAMPAGPDTIISLEDGRLMASISETPRQEILAEAKDRFFFKSATRTLTFQRGPDGKVAGAVMERDGVETALKRTSAEAPKAPREISVQPSDLVGLIGEYELRPGVSLAITAEGGRLFGRATGQSRIEMFAESRDRFFLKVVEARIEFQRGADGKATQLTLLQAGRQTVGKRK